MGKRYEELKLKIELINSELRKLPVYKRKKAKRVVYKKFCETDYALFVYAFMSGDIDQQGYFWGEPGILHEDIFKFGDEIAHSKRRKVIKENFIAPRGNAKSALLITGLALWQALYKREKYIVLLSCKEKDAKKCLNNIKNLLEDRYIKYVFRPVIEENNKTTLIVDGVRLEPKSIIQNIRGLSADGVRPTLILFDDVESEEMARSKTHRDKNWTTFTQAIEPSKQPPAAHPQTMFLGANTALHPDCLVMKLQRRNDWNTRVYKAVVQEPINHKLWQQFDEIYTNTREIISHEEREAQALAFYEENKEAMDEGSIVNWPAVEPYVNLRMLRIDSGENTFQREKQGNPIDTSKLRFAHYLLDKNSQIRKELLFSMKDNSVFIEDFSFDLDYMLKVACFDGAMGKEQGDYASLTCLAHADNNYDFVLSNLLMRCPVEEQMRQVILECQKWQIQYLVLESSTFQDLYKNILLQELRNLLNEGLLDGDWVKYKFEWLSLSPGATQTRTDKQGFIDGALTSLGLSNKTLFFNNDTGQISQEFFDQIIQFPTAEYDDGIDSLAQCLHSVYKANIRERVIKGAQRIDKV